jgi:MFS family permease
MNVEQKLSSPDVVAYRGMRVAEASAKPAADEALMTPAGSSSAQPGISPRPSLPIFSRQISLPSSLRALGHRNFRIFWSGQLISLIGTWMQMVARGWLVLELTHSPFWLGMVGFANSVPVLLLSLWAGAVADSVSKRALVMWTQSISMVMSLVLAALTFTNTVNVWHVLAVSVVLGTSFAFDAPTRQAFTVELVGKRDLMNAVALNSAIFNGARVAGPAIGAVALAWQGPGMAFLLNGLSYIPVLIGLARMDLPKHEKKPVEVSAGSRILEGLRYVRHNESIALLMMLVAVVSIFAFPYAILMPIFAADVLNVGEQGYGALMALSGVGALIGALYLTMQSGKAEVNRGKIILLGAIGMPVFLAVFALSTDFLLSLAMLVGVGWTMIAINATTNTVIQTNVPDELRGRVNGVFAFLFIGMAPFGNLQAGLLADHFGAPFAVFTGALVCAGFAVFILLRKRHALKLS